MISAVLTVTYPDGTSSQERLRTLPDARRSLVRLCARKRWHIQGTGQTGKLVNSAGKLTGCYLIRTTVKGGNNV